MSQNRPGPRQVLVIGAVVAGLAVVTVLNVRTFGPQGAGKRVASATADFGASRSDLDQALQAARQDLRQSPPDMAADTWPDAGRDPFGAARRTATTAPAPATKPTAARPRPKPSAGLVCTAVFLGGARPVALINGSTYGAGDKVAGHTVGSITTDGITVTDAAGKEIFMAVGPLTEKDGRYHVITSTRTAADAGQTNLERESASERSER